MSDYTDEAAKHNDAVADTGAAYTKFKGYVLACLWCNFTARGATMAKAIEQMQKHYDDIGASVDVLARGGGRG